MSKELDLAERVAARLVERHADVLLGAEDLRPHLDGQHVVFRDRECAVDALARDIREVLENPEPVAIRYVGAQDGDGRPSPRPSPTGRGSSDRPVVGKVGARRVTGRAR
jgi:hypothetical protein